MRLFYQPDIPEGSFFLDSEESRHCVKVLRKKEGDEIHITDGKNSFYTASIEKADSKKCTFRIIHQENAEAKDYYIHIALAPTKNLDRVEWFIEKSVEIGIDEISFIRCENSERTQLKTDRLLRKAVSAMKQSVKASLPVINELVPFEKFMPHIASYPHKFIAYVAASPTHHLMSLPLKHNKSCVLIGPEGDFTDQEIALATQNGFEAVSLGKSRLRTETAGVVACHILNLVHETRETSLNRFV